MSVSQSRLRRLAALEQRNAEQLNEMYAEATEQLASNFSAAQLAVLARLAASGKLFRPDMLSGSERELAEAFKEAGQQYDLTREGQKAAWAAHAIGLGRMYRETT